MDKRTDSKPKIFFYFACLAPLFVTDLVRTLITYNYSVDGGLWPLFLLLMFGFSIFYASLVYLLGYLTEYYPIKTVLFHTSLLGTVLVAHAVVYFEQKPDWLAIDTGMVKLTPFQAVVYNDWMPSGIYAVFYFALVVQLIRFRCR